MLVTDLHHGRTTAPYGGDALVENVTTLLSPEFGPFSSIFESFLPARPVHFEGHTYLGMVTIIIFLVWLIFLPFSAKRTTFPKILSAALVSGIFLLLFSFGWAGKMFTYLGINDSVVGQFRAVCRFAWFFYFVFPIFLIVTLQNRLAESANKRMRAIGTCAAVLCFCLSLWEAHFYFTVDKDVFWKFENVFSKKSVNPSTLQLIKEINKKPTQAILALPLFYNGSEMFDRIGKDRSMIPAMICSFHTGLPIIGSWLSRTSIPETQSVIGLLNSYEGHRTISAHLNEKNLAIIVSNDQLLPDEERLLTAWKPDYSTDSLKIGHLTISNVLKRKVDNEVIRLGADTTTHQAGLFYIPAEHEKPFVTSNLLDYEKIAVLDSNILSPGDYVLSLHYHLKKLDRQAIGNLIITRGTATDYKWQHNYSLSELSGFYDGFMIFERNMSVEKGCRYEFLVKGNFNNTYRVSHFMLRRKYQSVVVVKNNADTLMNNFPVKR